MTKDSSIILASCDTTFKIFASSSFTSIPLQLVKNNEIIYGPNCELQDKDGIYLDDYLKDEEWIERVNLATILNIEYLTK